MIVYENYTEPGVIDTHYVEAVRFGYREGDVSPRVGKKLLLRNNPYTRYGGHFMFSTSIGPKVFGAPTVNGAWWYRKYPYWDRDREIVLNALVAKFDAKLRKDGGSLGVSLATWDQSSKMISSRLKGPAVFFGKMLRLLENTPPAVRRLKKPNPTIGDVARHVRRIESRKYGRALPGKSLADNILEFEFGWKPLFDDIRTALSDFTKAVPPPYVRVAHKVVVDKFEKVEQANIYGMNSYTFEGYFRGSYAAQVQIENPNLWLANYLGLLNLPGIAWDLVPWSFLVNMFSNVGSLVNSITNEVGLSITERTYTIGHYGTTLHLHKDYDFRAQQTVQMYEFRVDRMVNAIPPRSLVFRWPKGNLELGLIAGSLITQQLDGIHKRLFR